MIFEVPKDGVGACLKSLRHIRQQVHGGRSVLEAWFGTSENFSRRVLLRHIHPGVSPFRTPPTLADGDYLPKKVALKWIDTAISYLEKNCK